MEKIQIVVVRFKELKLVSTNLAFSFEVSIIGYFIKMTFILDFFYVILIKIAYSGSFKVRKKAIQD